MENTVKSRLQSVHLGEPQTFKNIAIVPLIAPVYETFQYRKFLEEITAAEEREFPSIGYGTDHRFKGKDLAGAALIHEYEVIHAAFFHLEEDRKRDRMASYQARRRHVYE
jgi:hypothetical protein